MTAFCSRCHSEIRVTELRMPSRPISTQRSMHGPIPRGVPTGSISFCPVHGLGFKLTAGAKYQSRLPTTESVPAVPLRPEGHVPQEQALNTRPIR